MNQAALLRQMQKMQEDMAAAQEALAEETIDVTAGGGAITVTITGHQRVQSIKIDPDAIDLEDEEWLTDLQDLLVAAVNQAIEQSQTMAAERMESITGNLGGMLPGGLGGLLG
ncbi:MAG: YbaB/EbfC family nucleoid-associated protein [Phototrophicales bacterium]|nr:MAG: YbaB/EbfC family nucleoid-associated protein [Phototrophicales bacterium]